MGELASEQIFAVVPIDAHSVETSEEGLKNSYWIQAWKWGSWDHPKYGEENIDQEFASSLIDNFKNQVYNQDLPIDFEHGADASKGLQAAAWVRDMAVRDDGVYYLVEFTDDALSEIKAGKWRYFSPAYLSHWTDPATSQEYSNVPTGGGLTNRPFFKGMLPLNFSELSVTPEELNTFSQEWRAEYVRLLNEVEEERVYAVITNRAELPDSAFLYISPGGTKVDGKTKPDSLRHWPYKTADGKIDPAHVTAALRLIPRTQGVPESAKSAALAKLHRLSGSSEHREEESMDLELVRKFAETLGIELPAEFTEEEALAKFTELNEVIEPLKKAREDANKERSFREAYPREFEEMQKLKEARVQTDAREFASHYERFVVKTSDGKEVEDTRGFSSLVLQKIEGIHKEFAEGKPTEESLKDLLDNIAGGGIVDFKEYGSSRSRESTYVDVDLADKPASRKAFAELVNTIMKDDNLEYQAAISEAAKREPDLFTAYQQA